MSEFRPPATDETTPVAVPLPILLIVSCSAAWVVAQLSYNALPQLLEPIKVAFDRGDEVVTRMYGYELFCYAIVALAAAGPLARFSRVFVALLGGSVAVAAGIVYVFGNFHLASFSPKTEDDRLAETMLGYWVNFATHDDLNGRSHEPFMSESCRRVDRRRQQEPGGLKCRTKLNRSGCSHFYW